MKFRIQPQSLKERIALGFNLAPVPVVHSNLYAHCARAVCESVALGVFESIGRGQRSCAEIAETTGLHAGALDALLNLLVSLGYLAHTGGRFEATALTRKWLLDDSESSIADAIRFFHAQWRIYDHLPHFLRTGEGMQSHDAMPADQWPIYMRAMFQLARMGAGEVARKTPVPAGATAMLDIGGSHGLYSVELCRRVPTMHATVLDLPAAVASSAPILASINREGRVAHREGDILADDIGERRFDLVLISNLVHHFSDDQNRAIAKKVARALRPGGHFVIQDFLRPEIDAGSDTLSSVQNLFFAMTSTSGVHSLEQERAWQTVAGLEPWKVIRFLGTPLVQIVAIKP